MRSRSSRLLVGAAAVVVMGVPFTPAAFAGELTDPAGDTVDESARTPLDVPEADILKSWISVEPSQVVLGVEVRKPTDPLSDPAWEGETTIEWYLDTTGDGTPDFLAAYFMDGGAITGDVYPAGDDDAPARCELSAASYGDGRYTALVDAACIGSPTSVAYRVMFFYDTNPGDDDAPLAEDSSPDGGLSPSVALARVPAAGPPAGGAPVASAPLPAGTPSPRAPAAAPAPAETSRPAEASAPAGETGSARPSEAAPASPGPAGRTPAAAPAGAATSPAPDVAAPGLAATGSADRVLLVLAGATLALGGFCSMLGAGRRDTDLSLTGSRAAAG